MRTPKTITFRDAHILFVESSSFLFVNQLACTITCITIYAVVCPNGRNKMCVIAIMAECLDLLKICLLSHFLTISIYFAHPFQSLREGRINGLFHYASAHQRWKPEALFFGSVDPYIRHAKLVYAITLEGVKGSSQTFTWLLPMTYR